MIKELKADFITEAGYRAVVLLVHNSHHCGYVGIPKEHPLFDKGYSEGEYPNTPEGMFAVHGGITYSGGHHGYPIADDKELWWLGFDCAHLGDATLGKHSFNEEYAVFRDVPYVTAECEKLALQLKEYSDKANP